MITYKFKNTTIGGSSDGIIYDCFVLATFHQALYGVLLFSEKLNYVWLLGFSLILFGICMLTSVTVKTVKTS